MFTALKVRARVSAVAAACVVVVVALACAAPAGAILTKLPRGGYASYDAMAGSKAPRAARIFDAAFTNLDYSGGPVMPSSTNYSIVWQPSNYGSHTAFQTGYVAGVDRFFTDMAADSGQSTNSDAVATQYNDASGNVSDYAFTNGGQLVDTDPLPGNGCPANPGDICLSDAQLQGELNSFLSAHGLPHDLRHEYFLLTPPDVASCFDSAGNSCSGNADQSQQFCAYHGQTSSGFVYSNIPDLAGVYGCDPFVTSCPDISCSYDNGPADGVLSAISHEHNESITDPQPNNAWTDWGSSVGGENGDKCNNDGLSDPNVKLQPDGFGDDTPYNETINGDAYLIQREWSNQTQQCLDSFTANGTTAVAAFTQSAGSGNTVNFNAGASTASGGVAEYVWQFNDGPGQTGTIETASPTISHTFPAAGPYSVALTVMAHDGTSDGTAHSVTAGPALSAPNAAFTAPSGLEGSSLTFDGSGSTDPNPGGSITSYAWNFGDGSTASGAVVHHAYTHHGTYTATLTVTDNSGPTNAVSHSVVVTDEAPTAGFSFSPVAPTAGSPAAFDGTSSNDPDGSIVSYSWNFGDGGTATGATPSHTYATGGAYTATLTVVDSDGQTTSTSHTVFVRASSGVRNHPAALFTASPSPAFEGAPVSFNAAASNDSNPGGSITGYSWSFGDGTTASGPLVSHAFRAGAYTVTLTVTDSFGLTGTQSGTVMVIDEGPSVSFTPSSGPAGSSVRFSGLASDPDGSITSFRWSFGDGSGATGTVASHTFASRGTYMVTLTVTDSSGHTATVGHSVTISAAPAQCVVPHLGGKTLNQAEQALRRAHCGVRVGKSPRKPRRSPGKRRHWKLLVAGQSPAPGRRLPAGAKVSLGLAYRAVKIRP